MLLAITAATATLTLGLVLHGVTSQPYQQTRAATRGPDEVAYIGQPPITNGPPGSPQPVTGTKLQKQAQTQAGKLARAPGVTGSSGPFPLAGALVRANGITAGAEAEGRDEAPASVDQPKLTAGSWVRPGGVVLERTFAAGLGVGAGDRITLNGRPFTVAGIAVTAANPPYPNLCYYSGGGCRAGPPDNGSVRDLGLLWLTKPDALALATPGEPGDHVRGGPEAEGPGRGGRVRPALRHELRAAGDDPVDGYRRGRRPAGAGRAGCAEPGGLAGRAARHRQRGRAGRRPDDRAHPAGRAAQGGRRVAGPGHRHADGREPGPGAGRRGRGAGGRVADRAAADQPGRGAGRHAGSAVPHRAGRRAGAGGRARRGAGRDARPGDTGRARQHGRRPGRRAPAAAPPAAIARDVPAAAGAAAARAATGRPATAAGRARRGQRRDHHGRRGGRADLPRHRRAEDQRRGQRPVRPGL